MRRHVLVAVVALGAGAACSSSPNSSTATSTSSKAITTTVSQATTTISAGTDLQSLIPIPANSQRTDGPDSIHDNGIHLHFFVNGSAMDVMGAYKTAIQGKNRSLIVDSSSGDANGGTATYTASNGNAFGVFTGGGDGPTTDIEACAWPSKPANTYCGRGNR
jgi:hypothetical protein